MSNESKLAPHDTFSSTESSLATMAMANAASKMTGWQRKVMNVFIGIITVVSLIGLVTTLASWGSIPACDAQQTRDTLSDLNKENKFDATKYNFIKQVATSDTEPKYVANLGLKVGRWVEYDFRIFKDNGTIKVQITDVRR